MSDDRYCKRPSCGCVYLRLVMDTTGSTWRLHALLHRRAPGKPQGDGSDV